MTRRSPLAILLICATTYPALAQEQAQAEPGPLVREVHKHAEQAKPDQPEKTPEQKKQDEKELREKMRELEKQLQQTREQFEKKAQDNRAQQEKKAKVKVENIKLPENPNRKQCEEYIGKLREAAKDKRSYSSSDPLVKKLREIPVEHLDLLITEMTERTKLRYFANYAMREIEPETLRERFVKGLEENPNSIGVIVMQGWCEDVRPAIIKYMKTADTGVSLAWFQAAVELDEPELYPKLHEITISSQHASQFINMLKGLPDYDLGHTINVCWKKSKEGKLSLSSSSFSLLAAEHGNVDALGTLVSQLRYSSSYMISSSSYNSRRTNLLRFIDYRGSNTEIQKWYADNKDKLIFDHLRKRFVLPEAF